MRFNIWRSKKDGTVEVEEVSIPDDYTDTLGSRFQFPHCDSLILHRPGTCEFCDRRPDWQEYRAAAGIAFSNDSDEYIKNHGLVPCPSTVRRPAEIRDLWFGNVPRNTL